MRKNKRESSGRSGRGRGRNSRSGFRYKERSKENMEERAVGDNRFDSYIESEAKSYKAGEKQNWIRFLPPTWDNAQHYGYDIYVHYEIGPDNASYLCNRMMSKGDCPICDEMKIAKLEGDSEYASKLDPKKRVLVYLIDRDKENEGIKIWAMPPSLDVDIAKLCVDERSGEMYYIDDPEGGFDVGYYREGTKLNTRYKAPQIARRTSVMDDQEALQFVIDNPLPSALNFYKADYIKEVFDGGASTTPHSNEDDDTEDKNHYTEKEIMDMGADDLDELVEEFTLNIDAEDYEYDEDFAIDIIGLMRMKHRIKEEGDDNPIRSNRKRSGSSKASGGKRKKRKPDTLQNKLLGMDIDELDEFVENNELDLDTEEYAEDELDEYREDIVKEMSGKDEGLDDLKDKLNKRKRSNRSRR